MVSIPQLLRLGGPEGETQPAESPAEAEGGQGTDAPEAGAVQAEEPQAQVEEAADVMVAVRLAADQEEPKPSVPGRSTVAEAREAVAYKFSRPEIATKARIVRRAGGALASLKETAKLGSRRPRLVVGVDDLKAASGATAGLSLQEARSLQTHLKDGFVMEEFQKRLLVIEGRRRGAVAAAGVARGVMGAVSPSCTRKGAQVEIDRVEALSPAGPH